MNKAQLKKFRALLEEKRDEIVKKAKQTRNAAVVDSTSESAAKSQLSRAAGA